ncbi:MAG: methyltransferase domain-containing protein [Rhodospirillaceae bacterium]|nr:methyltransferase domain-containing protein [Rhodospirillaceae bacterium]MBT5659727.1 methyltransferase domain-containing protein [Rhodospirillaceae bacterium]MBT5753187.1 methyltransferase domain-containing protein [Rhodospirillaceae bacterium]
MANGGGIKPVQGGSCRSCGRGDFVEILDLGNLPIAHRFLSKPDEKEELFPLALHFCRDCGLTQILNAIDPEILYRDYNHNFSSWKPEPHLTSEIDMIFSHGTPRAALEVGCNDGKFMAELMKVGVSSGVGIEPNPIPAGIAQGRGLTVYQEMLSPRLCDGIVESHGQFDLVVARQVLEHLLDIKEFFKCVDRVLSPDGMLFIDVPDFEPGFRQGDCSVIWEEHVSYFTRSVLDNLLCRYEFTSVASENFNFSGGCLSLLARRSSVKEKVGATSESTQDLSELAGTFSGRIANYQNALEGALSRARKNGISVVLYGTGCRANMLVNGLSLGHLIDYSVDDQKERQGMFLPGSRLPIHSSEKLQAEEGQVLCLLAVNNENEQKVSSKCAEMLGDRVTCISLHAPKDICQELKKIENIILAA